MDDNPQNMALEDFKEELAFLVKGSSFSQLFQCLYYLQLFKLSTQAYLKAVNFDPYGKVTTKKKLQALVNLNYLKSHENEKKVFTTTNKTLQALGEFGYSKLLLPNPSQGKGGIESLYNTDEFVKAVRLPNYKAFMTEVQEESLKRFKRILFLGEHRENILMRLSRHAFVKTPNPEIPIYQLNADDIKALF